MRKIALGLLLIVLLYTASVVYSANHVSYVSKRREMTIVAVTSLSNNTYVGVSAKLGVQVICPGSGGVYVETLPLSQIDLQASTRIAAIVASRVSGARFTSCDYLASIRADSPIIGGPSASAATAVAFAAALLDLPLRDDVVLTGMIMPDGSIGPVGGLKLKLEAAVRSGAKVFLIPYGQTKYTETIAVPQVVGPVTIYTTKTVVIDLISYGRELGIEVIPVATVHEALKVFTNGRYTPPGPTTERVATTYSASVIEQQMKSWSETLRDRALKTMESGDTIKDSTLNSLPKSIRASFETAIRDMESEFKRLLDRADSLYKQKYLYSAASTYFQALIYSLWRLYLLKGLGSVDTLNTLRSYTENKVNTAIERIHSQFAEFGKLCLQNLDVAIATLSRAYEALLYLNKSLSESRIDRLTYYLAIAESRAITVELWSFLTLEEGGCCILNSEYVDDSIVVIENLVHNIYAYIISFEGRVNIPSTTFDEMIMRMDLMKKSETPLDRLSLGVDALAYGYVTLVSMFSQDVNSTITALGRAVNMELEAEPLRNCTPISLVLYLELAATQEESAISKVYTLTRISALISFYTDSLRERVEFNTSELEKQIPAGDERETVVSEKTITTVYTLTYSKQPVELVPYVGIGVLLGLLLAVVTIFILGKIRSSVNLHLS